MITQIQYEQFLEKIDEECTQSYDPVVKPVGNDDGQVRAALLAVLSCADKDLPKAREQLQQAYCAFYKINDADDSEEPMTILELMRKPMTPLQRAYDDAGVTDKEFA